MSESSELYKYEKQLYERIDFWKSECNKVLQENAELKRIIAEMRAVDSPDFEKLKELGWTFNLCEICGESLSASKPVIQEGMQYAKGASEERARLAKIFDEAGWYPYAEVIRNSNNAHKDCDSKSNS